VVDFDVKHIAFHKRIISLFWPVRVGRESSVWNPQLDVLFYRGRFQLAAGDALYSDGAEYTPAIAVVDALAGFLQSVNGMLICGAGLGSMVEVISRRGFKPSFTLVERDPAVLRLARAYLEMRKIDRVNGVCDDAASFLRGNLGKYDLIFLDIFDSRVVPQFVLERGFLEQCRNCLTPGGRLALNYIINDELEWGIAKRNFAAVFPEHDIITNDINRIFVSR